MSTSLPNAPPDGFVDLVGFIPEARLAIGYHGSDNFTGAMVPGYELPGAWLREQAARELLVAAHSFRAEGLGMVIYDAYRPMRATRALADWCRRHNPDLLNGYISERSRHSKGVSIDLGLYQLDSGDELDMGCPWDSFEDRAHTKNAEGAVLANRMRLRETMMAGGWDDYRREWWHFERLGHEHFDFVDVPYGR